MYDQVNLCDDGNGVDGDGCDELCHIETGYTCTGSPSVCVSECGDGKKVGTEACDDGNLVDGDGCDQTCIVETGWNCTGGSVVNSDLC